MRSRWMLLAVWMVGCGSGEKGETIKIGMNVSLSGNLAQFGATAEEVVRLAIDDINGQGGVNGRDLELVVLDDGTMPQVSAQNTDALIARGDIVAMIGPVFSQGSAASMPAIKANQLVSVSGSATATSLVMADDGGFYFMNVSDDNFQGIAMAKYLVDVADQQSVVLVYQTDEYGQGLATTFRMEYEGRGGAILAQASFAPGLDTQAEVDALYSQIAIGAGFAPMVVLITFATDGIRIIQKWDDSGDLPDLQWFFTDGVRDSSFVTSRPTALEGMRGTAPTHRNDPVFDAFAADYQARYGRDITQEVFQANYYDATFLIALALVQQEQLHPGEPLGGANLAAALPLVGDDMAPVASASGYAAAVATINDGLRVNYEGASGPCNFDGNGQAKGPIEVWRIADGLYVQDQYFESEELQTTP
jgi:branched-chain amino acid transport system substrate-binding protein